MCGKRTCGKMAGVPSNIPLNDMRKGSTHSVKTDAALVGAKPMLKDQRGMNQRGFTPKNPLNGKR